MPPSPSDPAAMQYVTASELPHGPLPARSDQPTAVPSSSPSGRRSSKPAQKPFFDQQEWERERRSGLGWRHDPRLDRSEEEDILQEDESVTDHQEVGSIMGESTAGADPEWGADFDSEGRFEVS